MFPKVVVTSETSQTLVYRMTHPFFFTTTIFPRSFCLSVAALTAFRRARDGRRWWRCESPNPQVIRSDLILSRFARSIGQSTALGVIFPDSSLGRTLNSHLSQHSDAKSYRPVKIPGIRPTPSDRARGNTSKARHTKQPDSGVLLLPEYQ